MTLHQLFGLIKLSRVHSNPTSAVRHYLISICLIVSLNAKALAQANPPQYHMEYERSHRASFNQIWDYKFPKYVSKRWFIALRYQPTLAWSRDVYCKAELLTSKGWIPFKRVVEGSAEKRPMLIIDYPHDDPKLKSGFTIRTTLIATIYTQRLADGPPPTPVLPLRDSVRQGYLAPTEALDFNEPSAKVWISQHDLWKKNGEDALAFARRVQRTLRTQLPYSVADGGRWNCSQIMKVGFGECARHAIVGTSILRANNIPARAVCTLWAVDESSKGAHCWGEFFLEGVGWVPYDSSFDQPNPNADAFFGQRDADFIAGMVDMDWLIDAGSLGKHSVFAIDAWPAFWAEGEGDFDGQKCETSTTVRVLARFR